MKKIIVFITIFSLFLTFGAGFVNAQSKAGGPRYLIKSTSKFWENALGARHKFEEGFTSDLTDFQAGLARMFGLELEPVELLHILPTEEVVETVAATEVDNKKGGISRRESTRALPSDQTPWGIEAVYGDSELLSTSGGLGIEVAVLDTGVLKTHPDLKNRIFQCKDFSTRVPVADGKCDDKNGHGTHVSGTILADGGIDGLGIYGIAPEARLYSYKVCGNDGSCWSDDINVALKMAADQGVKIVNMSLGSDFDNSFIRSGIAYAVSKGVLVIAAGGNDGPYAESIDYPGANSSVIAVAALDNQLRVADWSSRGVNLNTEAGVIEEGDMEFAAPGVNIESTWKNGAYAVLSGTSMSSPHISGLAAKLWQVPLAGSTQTAAELTRAYLKQISVDVINKVTPDAGDTITDVQAGEDNGSGYGFPQI